MLIVRLKQMKISRVLYSLQSMFAYIVPFNFYNNVIT